MNPRDIAGERKNTHKKRSKSHFLQSPHCTANCLQHVRSSGQGVVVCKSRATPNHLQHQTTCNTKPPATSNHLRHQTTCNTKPPATPNHLQHQTTCNIKPPATPNHLQHQTTCNTKPPATPNHLQHQTTCNIKPPATPNPATPNQPATPNHLQHQTTCNTKPPATPNHVSCATWYEGTAQLLSLTRVEIASCYVLHWLNPFTNEEGGKETRSPGEIPRRVSENATY